MIARRAVAIGGVLVLLAVIAWYALGPTSSRDAPTLQQMADEIGADVMAHLHRGHVPGRSGEIMLVPKPHRYLTGRWDLRTLTSGSPETFVSHPNPWAYLTRVPLIFYRPGHVPEGRDVDASVDLADVAPTYARIIGLDGFRADGTALQDVVDANRETPRLIVTIVLDGGGWNVLHEWPDAWPTMKRLSERGMTFTNATIGSAPSVTGPIHSNLGTGVYPATHGVPTNPWLSLRDPSTLRAPTVSELWDEHTGNQAVVAMMGFQDPHVGMIGRGAQRDGGDRDVAVFWDRTESTWKSNEEYYELPDYIVPTDTGSLSSYERELDIRDGTADGKWNGREFEEIRGATPAFARFTGDVVVEMIANERVGADEVTDLLWIEMKMPDEAGHAFNMVSVQEEQVLLEVDRQVARFVRTIERLAGPDDYLLAITADHGQEPFAEATGGWRINLRELETDIEAELGPVIEKVTTLDVEIDRARMEEHGVDEIDIVDFVASYTLGENIPDGAPGMDAVPEDRLDETLFAGAFPSSFLAGLAQDQIAGFGASSYAEGDLTSP